MQGVDEMNWKLGSLINSEFKKHQNPKNRAEVEAICELKATAVPGCLELDMMKEGKLPKEIYKGREAEDPKGDSPGDGWRKLRGVLLFCLFTTMIPESKEAFGEAYPCRKEKAKELEKP